MRIPFSRQVVPAVLSLLIMPLSLSAQLPPVDADNHAYAAAANEADPVLENVPTTIVERLEQPSSGVTIEAPEALLHRASRITDVQIQDRTAEDGESDHDAERVVRTKSGKTVGYRVQVFADNNARSAKNEARQRERAIGQAFPAYGTYVSYASPYWRLRVGDFRSQYDAEKAAAEIRKAFPRYAREVRVVRDHVVNR